MDTAVQLCLDEFLLGLVHELLWLVLVGHHQVQLQLVILPELLGTEEAGEARTEGVGGPLLTHHLREINQL